MRKIVAWVVFVFFLAVNVPTVFGGMELILPAIGCIYGAGVSHTYSTIWITNPSSRESVQFDIVFLRAGQSHANPPTFSDVIAPGATRAYENAAETLFGITDLVGAVRVRCSQPLVVSSRTFNIGDEHTIATAEGLYSSGIPADFGIRKGQFGVLQRVRQTADDRYDVFAVETGGESIVLELTLLDAAGAPLRAANLRLAPWEPRRIDIGGLLGINVPDGSLRVTAIEGDGRALVLGSQIAKDGQDFAGFEMGFRPEILGGIAEATERTDLDPHGALIGIANQGIDHSVLSGRVSATDRRTSQTQSIPATGPGTRMMWYPEKAVFRAGEVDGNEWDDLNVGEWSTAFGNSTTASGEMSFAVGHNTIASGYGSFAAGFQNFATQTGAVALGVAGTASGIASFAIGSGAIASGHASMAFGTQVSTAGHEGSFVFGDNSAVSYLSPDAPHQFLVRASGGTKFFSDSAMSIGVELPANGSGWSAVSDRAKKENFWPVEGEDILTRVRSIPLMSWNYRTQNPKIRHLGPIAQDFYAAFGLGEDELLINSVDIDGVNFAGVKALEERTSDQHALITGQQRRIEELEQRNRDLETRIRRLEGLLLLGNPGK